MELTATNRSRACPKARLRDFQGNVRHVCSFEGANLYSSLAQSVEHAAVNRSVVGSSPTGGVFGNVCSD